MDTKERYDLSIEELDRLVTDVNFEDLFPFTSNCTGVAVGIMKILPNNKTRLVSVDTVGNGLNHTAVEYRGTLFDASGQRSEIGEGPSFFLDWPDLTEEDLDAMGESGPIDEFVWTELIRVYNTPEEYNADFEFVAFDTEITSKAETRLRNAL